MKNLVFVFMFVALPGFLLAGTLKMDLSKAVKDHSVKVDAVNFEGHYKGKTTKLTITNITKSVLQVKVNLGVILKADDSSYQPMVLAGEESLVIGPGAHGQVDVQTFCGNSPGNCPAKDMRYSFSHVGSDTLLKILKFIKANSLFDQLGQSAVWAVTNNHSIGGVYDPERADLSKKLVDLLCQATGRPKPDYYTLTAVTETPNEPAYVPKALKIIAEFEIILDAPKTLSLGVFDDKGTSIQNVFENREFGKSGHRFGVEFEAADVPAGKYYIRLMEGETVLKEKMVTVE